MLHPWKHYTALKQSGKLDALAVVDIGNVQSRWFAANEVPRLIGLKELHNLRHQGKGLVLMPAYAQTEYVYNKHAIKKVDAHTYQATPPIERVNQFDALGACYREEIADIYVDYRLGCIISDAAAYAAEHVRVQSEQGEQGNVALMVIDALRTVDAGYLLAAANPLAVENKLLAPPGSSAHNKGMAVDLTLVYWNPALGCWMDADMHGHMDHPDMVTNHRNYQKISHTQRYNRLQLERIMVQSAWNLGTLIAPLREEFWDFRFPEDGLDLWRVLESIARIIHHEPMLRQSADAIEAIRQCLRSGHSERAYQDFAMGMDAFKHHVQEMLDGDALLAMQDLLGINEVTLQHIEPIYHGNVNVIYDADLPEPMRQANAKLKHLFE